MDLEKLMARFDITGQGTILAPPSSNAAAGTENSAPDGVVPGRPHTRSVSRKQSKNEQQKHAMTIHAAHVVTSDYVALSQPLVEGVMLMDRTERKLKLVHSLGELLPNHQYTTEYGNVVVRTGKYKALLADEIELEVKSDEADWDAAQGRLALASDGHGTPSGETRVAAYAAFKSQGREADGGGGGGGGGSSGGGDGGGPSAANGHGAGRRRYKAEILEEEELAFDEAKAMKRMAEVCDRMAEMEEWFESVQAEAEVERCMRESTTARLKLAHERLERAQRDLDGLQKENASLRQRCDHLQHAVRELGGPGGAPAPPGASEQHASGASSLPEAVAMRMPM